MPKVFEHLDDIYPAGLFRRLAAMVYDLFLLFALAVLVGFIGVSLADGEANEHPLFQFILLSVPVIFYAYFWRKSGQTLGMLAWKIRVQTLEGQPVNLRQTLLRLVGGILSWSCLGLGYLWLKFDQEQRTWPDILSGTQVVVIPHKKI